MKLKHFGSTLAALLLVAGFTFWTTGCGSSSTQMRFVSADYTIQGNIDVVVDNRVVSSNLAYGTGTSFLGVSSGTRRVEVRPTGNTSSGSDIVNTTINVQGGSNTTVVFDSVNGQTAATVFTYNNTAPASGSVVFHLIHAGTFYGPMDAYIIAQNSGISGVSPQVPNLAFNAISNPVTLSAGSYEVVFTFAGTQSPIIDTGTAIPAVTSQQIRTIVAVSKINGSNGYVILNDR
jgi:uncharacterized protein DUF4397